MMRRRRTLMTILTLMLAVSGSVSAEPQLREAAARKTAAGHEIAFTLTEPTDVTVRIVDAKGEVVRHLVSGMVGLEKAAAPFAPGSLQQKIAWDGNDDAGKPVNAAGCKVAIAAGMQAKFDKFILWQKDGFGGCSRIIAGPKDEYCVVQSRGNQEDTVRVFNAEGKRVRTSWPYSLNVPGIKEFLDTQGGAEDYDGNRVPVRVTHNERIQDFGPRFTSGVITTDGHMVGVQGYGGGGGPAVPLLNRATPEGFPTAAGWQIPWHPYRAPEGTPEEIRKIWRSGRPLWKLAPGRDGDFYLADGIHKIVARFRAKDFSPVNFTHSGTQKLDKPRNYIGELNKPGDDEGHFSGPHGVTVDKDGRILVMDGEVVKGYDTTGKFIEKKPRAESDYDKVRSPVRDGGIDVGALMKAEAKAVGSSGVPAGVLAAGKKPGCLSFPHFLRIDATGNLCVKNNRASGPAYVFCDFDGKPSKSWEAPSSGGFMCVDSQGNWYLSVKPEYRQPAELWKFSSDGKRLKFADKDAIVVNYGNNGGIKGVTVASNGDIYIVMASNRWEWPKDNKVVDGYVMVAGEPLQAVRVDVYSPDGELKKEALVNGQGINDVAVDRAGNVYVIETAMFESDLLIAGAEDHKVGWAGKVWPIWYLTPEQAALDAKTQANKRFSLISRLIKYPPGGGTLVVKDKTNHIWDYAGVSGAVPVKDLGDPGAQISIDADERIWVPDAYMYCIKAVDKAGNLMTRIGQYGNEDCEGGGGDKKLAGTNIIIDPEIPLARPQGVVAWKDYLFISDMYSHRVMRCRLEYRDRKDIDLN